MPGIDFTLLRRQVSLLQVLDLMGFTATTRCGPQLRGPCPVHRSKTPRSRSFAAHVGKNCRHCFGCGAGGNALDLYLAVTKLPVYAGALELCARLGVGAPRRHRRAGGSPARIAPPTCRRAARTMAGPRSPPP